MALCQCTTLSHPIVVLVDVDNTLLDHDRIQQDLKDHLERAFGLTSRERYWTILEDLFMELGYRDYIGALQRYRVEHPRHVMSPRSSVLSNLANWLRQSPVPSADAIAKCVRYAVDTLVRAWSARPLSKSR
jgi:FMN phosphatase YigB (HAD superfamily)